MPNKNHATPVDPGMSYFLLQMQANPTDDVTPMPKAAENYAGPGIDGFTITDISQVDSKFNLAFAVRKAINNAASSGAAGVIVGAIVCWRSPVSRVLLEEITLFNPRDYGLFYPYPMDPDVATSPRIRHALDLNTERYIELLRDIMRMEQQIAGVRDNALIGASGLLATQEVAACLRRVSDVLAPVAAEPAAETAESEEPTEAS